MKKFSCIAVFLIALLNGIKAADIISSGDWTEIIDSNDLAGGPGTDVMSQHESVSGVTAVAISNTAGGTWKLKARKLNGTWASACRLWVKRTSDGSGGGMINGGTVYIELTTLDAEISSGTGDLSNIAIQYKLTGMSKDVTPNHYNASVIFTLE